MDLVRPSTHTRYSPFPGVCSRWNAPWSEPSVGAWGNRSKTTWWECCFMLFRKVVQSCSKKGHSFWPQRRLSQIPQRNPSKSHPLMMFSPKQEMTSPQGEVLRIVRELEFDHHSTWVKRVFFPLCVWLLNSQLSLVFETYLRGILRTWCDNCDNIKPLHIESLNTTRHDKRSRGARQQPAAGSLHQG